jgi:hypothetical protein
VVNDGIVSFVQPLLGCAASETSSSIISRTLLARVPLCDGIGYVVAQNTVLKSFRILESQAANFHPIQIGEASLDEHTGHAWFVH